MIEDVKKDKESGKITFTLTKSNPAFANSLRRLMMDSVPVMAIETVEFVQNSSAVYDEMLAHRLGLIPLTTDLKGYDLKKEGDELSAKNSITLSLKAKGPCTVYADELKSKDPKIKPVYPKTPIVKLLKGQELEFTATAILGIGKQHVKFSPGLVWYRFSPKVTINNNHKDFEKFREKYPPQVFANEKIDAKKIEELNLYEACDGVNDEIVKVDRDPTEFTFTIETWGQLSPAEILAYAADCFTELLTKFADKMK